MFQQSFTFRHGSRTFPRDKKFFFGRREQRTTSYRYRPRRRTVFHFIEFPHAQIRIYLTRQIFDSTKTYFHRSLSRHENHTPLPGAPEISRLGCVNLSTTWTRGKALDTGGRGRMYVATCNLSRKRRISNQERDFIASLPCVLIGHCSISCHWQTNLTRSNIHIALPLVNFQDPLLFGPNKLSEERRNFNLQIWLIKVLVVRENIYLLDDVVIPFFW